MIGISTYLLESSICMLCFYGIFYFLLKNETWFQFNRLYLLFSVLLSLTIPALHYAIEVPIMVDVATEITTPVISNILVSENIEASNSMFTLNNLSVMIFSIYVLGIIISSSVFIRSLSLLRTIFRTGVKERKGNLIYVYSEEIKNIFSFFNCIFINQKMNEYSEAEQLRIINHEKAHIRERHTLDLMVLELLKIVFWFNPIVYAYKGSMLQLHEFIADEKVIKKEGSPVEYAKFLVSQVKESTRVYSFCNHLFHEPIKNRLIMMNKSKSKGRNALMSLSAIPVLLGLAFSFCIDYQEIPINTSDGIESVADASSIIPLEVDSTPAPKRSTPPSDLASIEKPKKGDCFAKCIIPTTYKVVDEVKLNVYTGNDSNVDTEEKEVVISPARTKWVKKKATKDSDELVWALVEISELVEKVMVVKDISQTSEYETRTLDIKGIDKEGGFSDWKEVVCADDITPKLIEEIQTKLRMMDFDIEITKKLDEATKTALSAYQKKNNFPIGNLNMETMKALGIEI